MPKNLLLADDSVTMQKVVAITFACEDFKITVVDNGEDALARARELKPDIVLADVVMPKQTGYDVCAALKADPALRHVPVLLLAGRSEKFDEAKARAAQADGHIEKPFESGALINKVKELVERKAAPAPQPVPTLQPVAQPAAPRAAVPAAPQAAPVPAPAPHVAPAPAPVPSQPRPAAARPAAPPAPPVAPPFAARPAAPPPPPAPPFAAAARPPAPAAPPVAPPFAARPAVIPPPAPVAQPAAPPLSAAPARPAAAPARPAVAPPRPEAAPTVAAQAASVAAAAIAAEPEPEEWADIELEDVVEDDRGEARDSLLAASAISFEEPEPVVAAAPPVADSLADPFDAVDLSAPTATEAPPPPAWEPPPPLAFDPEPPAFDHDLDAPAQAPEAMAEPQAQVVSSVEELDFGEPPPAIDLAAETAAPPTPRLPQLELDGPGLELDAPVHVFAKAGVQVEELEPPEELDPVAEHESEPAWAAAGAPVEVPEPLDALPEPLSLSPAHEFLPPAANTGHAPEGSAAAPNGDGGEAQLREALSKASREVIERIAWEVVPQLAEVILREHVERLARSRENR